MQFRVLGPLEVDGGDGPIPLGGPKQRAVLANLLMRANEVVPAETLITELWGDDHPEKARNTLQTYISNLRRSIGDDALLGRSPGYLLSVDPHDLDTTRFDTLMREAQRALPLDPGVAVATFEDALALWRGPALADVAEQPSLLAAAARLDELRVEAQEGRAEGLLAAGAPARAVGELEPLVTRHPLREHLWGLLMVALYRDGRQADALNAYQHVREILADELGIDPSPELSRLHERILRHDDALELRGEGLRGYRLLEKIGEGRSGTVFRAIQPRVGREVAVKVFHERVADDPEFVQRFERDAQAVAALEHPHIVPVYDSWREPGRAYIVTRYLRGGSLRGREARDGPPDGAVSERIVDAVAAALSFAHQAEVVHGDVTSANVLFDGDGHVYLTDFVVGRPAPTVASDREGLASLARHLLGPDGGRFGASGERHANVTDRNPYKGLRSFTEADRRDFFGRGALIERLLGRLHAQQAARFLAVVGPSGSGKSSAVHAGLVPAIRDGGLGTDDVAVAQMVPGVHPIDELERAVLRVATRNAPRLHDTLDRDSRGLLEGVDLVLPGSTTLVLVVDQFEEVFTLAEDEGERERFLEALRIAAVDPDSRVHVVVTLRADFYDRPLVYPRFGELLAARTEAVPPLTADELEQAVRRPAELVGVTPEPGLVADAVADVVHQPGALPLLQYAMTELFERRDGDGLTLESYRQIGGVTGALSARADRLVQATDEAERRAIRQVFLRLVTLGEGQPDTRRRVVRSELDSLDADPALVDRVLETFGRHRLLTFDREPSTREPTVEIAHEALLHAWDRLRRWIDEARDDLRAEQRLARAAGEWSGSGLDASFLLRGSRLDQVEAWSARTGLVLGRTERAYLAASLTERERERAEEASRRERERWIERRSARRLRGLVAVFATAALIAGSLTIVATDQRGRARREAAIARAVGLAAESVANIDVDPELSILLAMASVDATRSIDGSVLPQAEEALRTAITSAHVDMALDGLAGDVVWVPGWIAGVDTTARDVVQVRDPATGEIRRSIDTGSGQVLDLAAAADGSLLFTAGQDGTVRAWDPSTGMLRWTRRWPQAYPRELATARRVPFVAVGVGERIELVDAVTGGLVGHVAVGMRIDDVAVEPGGDRIVVAGHELLMVDLGTGTASELARWRWGFEAVAWHPNGGTFAVGNAMGVQLWDATGEPTATRLLDDEVGVRTIAWAGDGTTLAAGVGDGRIALWAMDEGVFQPDDPLASLELKYGEEDIAFSPDGTRLVATGTRSATAKVWATNEIPGTEMVSMAPTSPISVFGAVEITPDGRSVVAHETWDSVSVWDLRTGSWVRTIGRAREFGGWLREPSLDVAPDGAHVAIVGSEGRMRVWEMASGEEVEALRRGGVITASWSPDGTSLVVAGADGTATISDLGGRIRHVLVHPTRVFDAEVLSDGRHVATYQDELGEVWIWDVHDLSGPIRTIHTPSAWDLAFDATGTHLITGTGGGSELLVSIWDVATGTRTAELNVPGGALRAVFSADGTRVVTVGTDGAVRVFDASTGDPLFILGRHLGTASGISLSPDGRVLATSDGFGVVKIWAFDVDLLRELAREELTRTLTEEECRRYLGTPTCPALASSG